MKNPDLLAKCRAAWHVQRERAEQAEAEIERLQAEIEDLQEELAEKERKANQ